MSDAVTRARELLSKATPGPWELISAAPTLLSELADEVERLTPVCSGCLYEPEAECPVHGYSRAELLAEFERLTYENGDLSDYACVCVGGEWDLTCPVHTDGEEDVISASERISVLTDEVERLRALTTVDDAMVERAAREIELHAPSYRPINWPDDHRELARIAIEAALGVES